MRVTTARSLALPPAPLHPVSRLTSAAPERVRVLVEYDADFRRAHDDAETMIAAAFDRVNVEWQRYRREWLDVVALRLADTGSEVDASHVLARFMLATAAEPSTIHVRIVGRQLEVYSNGRTATPIGGLAFRGSDVVVVSAPPTVSEELLAYYLFHEIGHLWDAFDIPFSGGDTTYGAKSRYTFDLDAGNAQILEESHGPRDRRQPNLAPGIIAQRLASARRLTSDPAVLRKLHDVLLHEATPANPAWRRKKAALLAEITDHRIRRLITDHETTPAEAREESEARRRLAEHYWRANDALAREDSDAAERELAEIRSIQAEERNANIRTLVGAVERKVRRRTR